VLKPQSRRLGAAGRWRGVALVHRSVWIVAADVSMSSGAYRLG
jgi:hypothetical protein